MARLNKIIIENNISVTRAIDKLRQFSNREFDKNTKLTKKEIEFLNKEFSDDRNKKIKSKQHKATSYIAIDLDFKFSDEEIIEYSDFKKEYDNCSKDIELL
ncbi:MAG: hypothetical protein P8H23_04755 [Flavobacteriaceae bacterium]|nr:hypothetical protein [Flavobacteriaceae bacterium]